MLGGDSGEVDGVLEALKPKSIGLGVERLREELRETERRILNLTEAIAEARTELPSLLRALQAEERRREELGHEIGTHEKLVDRFFDRHTVERFRSGINCRAGRNCLQRGQWRTVANSSERRS